MIVEALYKLSIASKASMFSRVQNYKLLSKWMGHWLSRVREHITALEQAASDFQQRQSRIILRAAFNRWEGRYNAHQEDEAAAINLHRSHTMPKLPI